MNYDETENGERKPEESMITVAVIGIVAALLAAQVKALKPEYGVYVSLAVCLVLFSAIAGRLTLLVDEINRLQSYVKLDAGYVGILLKMTGITYIAELASDLCKDAGYQAVAGQIELFGKLALLSLSMPVVLALLETVSGFLSL